jgi:predicted dehydrogenase
MGTPGCTGFAMAHAHLPGFVNTKRAELVAICEIDKESADIFLARNKEKAVLAADAKVAIYKSYKELLSKEKLDIVSICLWPHLHAEVAIAACEAGVPAVHCEKPMALTWGDAKRMKAAADANGVKLTFNHQRRHLPCFQLARKMLFEGAIGEVERFDAECGDLFDWGTHWFNMMCYLNGDVPAKWVLGQIDVREDKRIFGALVEGQAAVHWRWVNDVAGSMITGYEMKLGCAIRVWGSEGMIEIPWSTDAVRIRVAGDADWRVIEAKAEKNDVAMACEDVVQTLEEPGRKSILSVDSAILSTELIFAAFHSSRWRGRVELPLQPEDSGLLDLIARREIGWDRRD